jgi:hypothetical protein
MSSASYTLASSVQSIGALVDWRIVTDDHGIVELNHTNPEAFVSMSMWSMLDRQPNWPVESDKLQIELVCTLPWLEQRVAQTLGDTFLNEMGKTVSVFLHRLIPKGRQYGSGFPVSQTSTMEDLSIPQLSSLVATFGLPFFQRVVSKECFSEASFLPPTLIDPVNWAVRRALAESASNQEVSAASMLAELAPQVERDLDSKYSAIASVSRRVDRNERVRAGVERLHGAIQRLVQTDA